MNPDRPTGLCDAVEARVSDRFRTFLIEHNSPSTYMRSMAYCRTPDDKALFAELGLLDENGMTNDIGIDEVIRELYRKLVVDRLQRAPDTARLQ